MLCVCCVYGVWYVCVVYLWENVICAYEVVYVVCDRVCVWCECVCNVCDVSMSVVYLGKCSIDDVSICMVCDMIVCVIPLY